MLIDKTHRNWAIWSTLVLIAGSVCYWLYARAEPNGPTGGSRPGLIFGVIGSAMMVFAWLLAGRKRVRALPLGSAQFWLKGHMWLGTLSMPFILFHAGFGLGGALEKVLWIVFGFVYISGFVGLGIQQVVPRLMSARLVRETFDAQVPFQLDRTVFLTDRNIAVETGVLELNGSVWGDVYKATTDFYSAADKETKGDWIELVPEESRSLFRNLALHCKNKGWVRTVDDFPSVLPSIYSGLAGAEKKKKPKAKTKAKAGGDDSPLKKARAGGAGKPSPLDQLRPKKKEAKEPDAAATTGSSADRKQSPLEKIRAQQAAAAGGKPAGSGKKSPIEQIRAQQAKARGGIDAVNDEPAETKSAEADALSDIRGPISISDAILGPLEQKERVSVSGAVLDSDPKQEPVTVKSAAKSTAKPAAEAKDSDEDDTNLSPLERIRRQQAARSGEKPAGNKKLSPLEQIRAKAKAKDSGAASGEQKSKKASPLDQIRAKAASGGGKKPSPLDQLKSKQKPAGDDKPQKPKPKPKPPAESLRPTRTIETPQNQRVGIRDFYLQQVRPYLTTDKPARHPLNDQRESQRLFARMRTVLSAPALRDELATLEAGCNERRQFAIQKKLHRVLHGWLMLHVPASMALLVLFLVHVIMALRVVPF